jgi:hypothetical protein
MRSSLAQLFVGGLLVVPFALGCATPTPSNDTGTAGSSQSGTAGSSSSGSAGTTGSGTGTGNTTGSGSAGTTGSGTGTGNSTGSGTGGSSATGAAGTGGPACVADPTNLVRAGGWICDLTAADMVQGSWYSYGDGTGTPNSMCMPATGNPCSDAGCCMKGATVVDSMYKAWGCGIGMELASSGGTTPTKSVYAGPAKCFNVTLTGNTGGNPVRIAFSQSATPAANAVSPYTEIPAFTSMWTGKVCFADVTCPSYAVTAGTCTKTAGDGTPVDMQVQIPGGDRAGNFNVCITKVEPILSTSTGTGGSGGGTASCATPSGSGSLTTQFQDAHVMCPKDYIVQNNAWGSTAGQTVMFGPGAKFKVTTQNENRANNSTPAGYPSIFTGAYNNRSTANSGLPRAISQIAAGSLMTSFTWADNGAQGSWNAAYDVWFSTSSNGDPTASGPSGGYLMVWYYKPSDNQPVGALLSNGMGSATIGGKQFNVWYGTNNGKPVVSYVATSNFNSWTYSLGDFIQDATTRSCQGTTKCLNSSWYLTAVFGGFEIWRGSVGLEVKDFGVTVP